MLEPEWEEGFKIVEVIEVTASADTVLCVIGAWPPGNKAVCLSTYRNGELVHEETFGFGPTLPMAELVSDLGEHLRNDARAMGARFEIPEPFGQDQFEAVVAARGAAACRTWGSESEPTASGPPSLR